jgi:hypothetical protein
MGGDGPAEGLECITAEKLLQSGDVVDEHNLDGPPSVLCGCAARPATLGLRGVLGAVKVKETLGHLRKDVTAVSVAPQNPGEGVGVPDRQHRHPQEGGGATSHLGASHRLAHGVQEGLGRVFGVKFHGPRPLARERIVTGPKNAVGREFGVVLGSFIVHIERGAEALSVEASKYTQGSHNGGGGRPVVAHIDSFAGGGADPCHQAAQQVTDLRFEAATRCAGWEGALGLMEAAPEGSQARGGEASAQCACFIVYPV